MEIRFGAVILAAGKSSRMGRPKLLLPWGEGSVLAHLVRTWKKLGASQVGVVLANAGGELAQELDRIESSGCDRILNPTPESGMFSSLQCASRWPGWQKGLTHIVVVLGDQPHLRTTTLQSLLEFAGRHSALVCQPGQSGHAHHPVLLPWREFKELGTAKTRDLRSFLQTCSVALCEVNDPGLSLDIDTPEDYERALKLGFSS